jgi:hypothetical protein
MAGSRLPLPPGGEMSDFRHKDYINITQYRHASAPDRRMTPPAPSQQAARACY